MSDLYNNTFQHKMSELEKFISAVLVMQLNPRTKGIVIEHLNRYKLELLNEYDQRSKKPVKKGTHDQYK